MRRILLPLAIVSLVVIACGGDDQTDTTISSQEAPSPGEDETVQTPPPETTPERESAGPTAGGAPETTATTAANSATGSTSAPSEGDMLTTADTDLGTIVVDPEGMTLYAFANDADGESTCYDACAATWPPLGDEGQIAGAGIDEALLGTTARDDGTTQITYNGWPLYYYVSDEEPGDVQGQGVGDVWFVIDPAGEMIESAG